MFSFVPRQNPWEDLGVKRKRFGVQVMSMSFYSFFIVLVTLQYFGKDVQMFHAIFERIYLCLSKHSISQKTGNGTGTLDIWSKNSFSPVHGGSSSISGTVGGASASIAVPTPPTPSRQRICFRIEMATWQHIGQTNFKDLTTKQARNRQSASDVVGKHRGPNPRRTTNASR